MTRARERADLGAHVRPGGVEFRVLAPRAERLAVKIVGPRPGAEVALERDEEGVHSGLVEGARPEQDYVYVLDRRTRDGGRERVERPDPASRFQPAGVHGPSRVIDPRGFRWTDAGWAGIPLEDYVVYELHVGTFTAAGTFEAAIARIPHLVALGVTAVEIMPVAEFPGGRNWGYDGVYPYAVQSSYGGPRGLVRLVDACHGAGLAVVLDVVYNHLGPEGSYLGDFAPFFTSKYRTPWGEAVNFDDADSDLVRAFVVENALQWVRDYHVDALRLDAVHAIYDLGPRHILEELGTAVREEARRLGRVAFAIAESDLNDVRLIRPIAEGGLGLDAQWSDDFHHAACALLTGARHGYFVDFGRVADLEKAIALGFVQDGTRRSTYRRRRHGSSAAAVAGRRLVVALENHDQVANASGGRRLSTIVPFEAQKLAAALLLAGAPNVPLLFMGEEYGETAPFYYFTSHGDPALGEAVREGRRRELEGFGIDVPDPQAEATFRASKLDWSRAERAPHAAVLRLHRDLLRLRREHPALAGCRKELTRGESSEEERWLVVERGHPSGARAVLVANLAAQAQAVPAPVLGETGGEWRLALHTADTRYDGPGAPAPPAMPPHSAALLLRET